MSIKITSEHLGRIAVVYVRQSTMAQVTGNLESQRRQYDLAKGAEAAGFASVTVIDDDLGRSGSGTMQRPGFERLVAMVCSGDVGAVYCIEASRLARNGRDWHHLIDLCALAGAVVIDPDGAYDPRLVNDRLLLGLKGTMSEYELSLLRQRGIAARDSKALRGELQFILPPGYCWNEIGQIEMDPDERVGGVIRLLFDKFQELGSARQVLLWAQDQALQLPITRRNNSSVCKIEWRPAAYHTVLQILRHPVYAGAYVFGRTTQRTRIIDGRARKTTGHSKPMAGWNVLLRDHRTGCISWEQYEANQKLISENAHMQRRAERKSARGGRALLTGLIRCGRCGRTMRVFYGTQSGHAHRYHCRGDDSHVGGWLCIGIGGVRIDRAVAAQIVEAVSEHAVDAAIQAADQSVKADNEIRQALCRELEEARYDASLAARRYEVVDPTKRLVARELETRWNTALERVAHIEDRIAHHDVAAALRPKVDRAALMALARDLPATWNAPGTDARTKQRITHILIREVVLDRADATNEAGHDPLERRASYRIARLARANRTLPGRSPPKPGGGGPQTRRPIAGSRTGRDDEPDAVQTRRRQRLDHRSGARASRAARDRRFRSDATARRDNQRRRRRDPARHLRRLGPQADPRGRASRDAADAVGALADPRHRTRKGGRQDRRPRNRRPPSQVLQALSRR